MDDDCVTRKTDKGKEKMVNDYVTTKANIGNKRVVEDGENSNDNDDSQDGCSSHSAITNEAKDVAKYVEVIDNDSFNSSESDEGDDIRKRKLKELRKNNTCDDNLNEIPFFYGQRFGSSNEVKLLVKNHSLETRRELKLVKNDKEREGDLFWHNSSVL
nr:transposase, mutator type [Tanacetum cinerariifolium]